MFRAMEAAEQCVILQTNPRLPFQDNSYRYLIERRGKQSIYSVSNGKESVIVPVRWALGQGSAGQTYIFELGGDFYESRVSYFSARKGLDLTMGANPAIPVNITVAAGQRLSSRAARDCIACHATNAVRHDSLDIDGLVPGIQCARCHETAKAHEQSVNAGPGLPLKMTHLGQLSTEEMSNFCGQCHRTWEEIAAAGPHDIRNVRFQPYRLANSKCYNPADPRIRCTSCHDPHQELALVPASYDGKCLACHAGQVNRAATSAKNPRS